MKKISRDPLQVLPGIGPSMANDLRLLGINTPSDLVGQDSQLLYDRLCAITGQHQDRCVLYVFRCAVWVAENPDCLESDLCNWWHWKDTKDSNISG